MKNNNNITNIIADKRFSVVFEDPENWRVGIYKPEFNNANDIDKFEKHSCPELFICINGKMGLVTKTMKHGIICFFIENPDKGLEDMLLKKQADLDLVNQNLLNILPDIKNMHKQELYLPKMRYYEGIEGVKRVYKDTLIESEPIYAFENVSDMSDDIKDYIFKYELEPLFYE